MVEQVLGPWAALKAGWEGAWRIAEDLWHELARAVPVVGRTGAFIAEVLSKYHKDDCLSYAAGLSFWLIVSLVPLSTLLFKLLGAILRDGRTLIPTKLYFNEKGMVKLELSLAKGKKLHDKRATEADRDWKREQGRIMRDRG